MADNIFIQIPHDVADVITLKRFLAKLIQEIDGVFTNAKDSRASLESSIDKVTDSIDKVKEELSEIEKVDKSLFIKKDGSVDFTDIVSYDTAKTFTSANELISKKYADDEITKLKALITALGSRVTALESRVTALESTPPPA